MKQGQEQQLKTPNGQPLVASSLRTTISNSNQNESKMLQKGLAIKEKQSRNTDKEYVLSPKKGNLLRLSTGNYCQNETVTMGG